MVTIAVMVLLCVLLPHGQVENSVRPPPLVVRQSSLVLYYYHSYRNVYLMRIQKMREAISRVFRNTKTVVHFGVR